MRVKTPALIIVATLLIITSLSLAQNKGSGQTQTASGILTTTFETPHGKVRVKLPDDMAAGDTISGIVTAEPSGKTDQEKQRNTDTLNGYVVELEKKKSPLSGGVIQGVYLAPGASTLSLILLDAKGKQFGNAVIPVAPGPTTKGPSTFTVSRVGQTGKPIQVRGPFDGDSANTRVRVGGSDAKVLAESPRKMVCESPRDAVGPGTIEVTEKGATATGAFRNLEIELTAPKTSLLKGEKTELHVQVSGLEGITQPIPIQLQNQSPSTVNVSGGNTQTIQIQPGQVQTGGTFPWSAGLTGTGTGGFTITATLPTGIYAAPAAAPPPSTTPIPGPSRLPSGETVVTRPADPAMPGGDRIETELVELQLSSNRPLSSPTETSSPTSPISNPTEPPDPPGVPEPTPRPPDLKPSPDLTPSPDPTRPPYVPLPVPPPDTTPNIPGSGGLKLPRKIPPPSPCHCVLVDIKTAANLNDDFTVTKGAPVFEGQPQQQKQTGLNVLVGSKFSHTMKCTGTPNPCKALVFWKADLRVVFKQKDSSWSTEDTESLFAPLVPPTPSLFEVALEGKCLEVPGRPSGCEVSKNYTNDQKFVIKYPDSLVAAIAALKAGQEVKFGDVELTITWLVTVKGCKQNALNGHTRDGDVIITRSVTWTGLKQKK